MAKQAIRSKQSPNHPPTFMSKLYLFMIWPIYVTSSLTITANLINYNKKSNSLDALQTNQLSQKEYSYGVELITLEL